MLNSEKASGAPADDLQQLEGKLKAFTIYLFYYQGIIFISADYSWSK
jgi:hypothetical protein